MTDRIEGKWWLLIDEQEFDPELCSTYTLQRGRVLNANETGVGHYTVDHDRVTIDIHERVKGAKTSTRLQLGAEATGNYLPGSITEEGGTTYCTLVRDGTLDHPG